MPVGVFLSGGIDSSLVAALMQAHSGRPVHSFAIGFQEKQYDETGYARAVADHLGTFHTEMTVSAKDVLDLIPRLPWWFDEPLAVRSQIPALVVSRLARRQVTVALCGDGGDELFGGYPGYYIARGVHRIAEALAPPLRRRMADFLDAVIAAIVAVCRMIPAAHRPGLPANQARQIIAEMRAGGGIAELHAQLYSAMGGALPLIHAAGEHPMLWQLPRHRNIVTDPIDRMGYFALLGTLVDRTLAKVDRASMAYSLEVRVPFLDHRVIEYAWRLPPALKYGSRGKPLLRRLLYRYVPAELVDRPKRGFSCPLPGWLRGPLRDWAEELLDER